MRIRNDDSDAEAQRFINPNSSIPNSQRRFYGRAELWPRRRRGGGRDRQTRSAATRVTVRGVLQGRAALPGSCGRARASGPARVFGCIACGHCMVVCPHDAITVRGRDSGLRIRWRCRRAPNAPATTRCTPCSWPAAACASSVRRGGIVPGGTNPRHAASAAPMGIPPSEVGVLVFEGRAAVKGFRDDLLAELVRWRKLFAPPSWATPCAPS